MSWRIKAICKILGCLIIVAVVFLTLIGFVFRYDDYEAVRLSSPDNKFDAVVIQQASGAWGTTRYLVHIVRSGQKPTKKGTEVFAAKRAYELRIKWESDRELLIQYEKADIYQFRNYLYPFDNDPNYKINIREVQDGKE